MLHDASRQKSSGIPTKRGAEWAPVLHWRAPRPLADAMAARVGPAAIAVPAYVNAGRWVVECPDCHSAQLACRTDHRFMCSECANAAVGGLWRPVRWPAKVDQIEALLAVRPVENRNCMPGETLKQLRAENSERDLPTGGKS